MPYRHWLPGLSRGRVTPRYQPQQPPGRRDAFVQLDVMYPCGRRFRDGFSLANADHLRRTDFGLVEAVLLQPIPRRQVRVRCNFPNSQVVIFKHFESTLLLHAMMHRMGPPADHRLLIGPDREREQPTLGSLASKAFVIDESLDPFQFRSQHFGKIQILVPTVRLWLYFKDHCKHHALPWLPQMASTG